jgi:YHS domain-containing protein
VPKIFLGYSEGTNRACYSEDTYVLTDRGWKLHQDIKDEKIAVYDPKTDTIRFEKPLRLYAYDYEGPMYHFKSKAVDVLVTPEHKMLFKTYGSPKWRVERAENLPNNAVFKSIVKSALPSIKITEKIVRQISKVEYKGKVYCFATSTGFYVTMRNGKPAIQGNTAEVVMQEYVTRLRMMQEIIGDTLETVLFKQLIRDEFGEGVEIPKVKWKPIWEPSIQDKAKYLCDLVDKGIILPKEARTQLGFPEEYPITTPEELQAILKRNGVKP